ncbi:MAG: hypothetical protein KHY35_20965 [Bacteroides thetaiotaomicron]|uniref:Uncharacterized protein n=1 Tax=Bacteroides thetaiotaomicron TaxID=818 RepID=A0A943DSG6_BACT4|nr:hypothetical protein [Bacteroides thetaiotaomicron]
MIKRQISFLFEDPGFCIDVFCTIAEPVRYYNRDTESGAWYSSTPDWNENGSLIREDLIFEVIADGVVCALDGNGNFEGKKPFVPFCQFRQSLVQSVHTQYPHLQNQEALREKLLSLPDARETVGHGWYWENWLFATDFENTVEEAVDSAEWLNSQFHILAVRYTHKPTGFVFTNYRFRDKRADGLKKAISKKMSTPCACSLYAPKQRQQPTNSFTTATPAKNGISISAKQVWRAAQQ